MKTLSLAITACVCAMTFGCTGGDAHKPPAPNAAAFASPTDSPASNDKVVTLTPAAIEKFRGFLAGSPGSFVLLSVKKEGPTGFMYDLQIENPPIPPEARTDRSDGFPFVVSRIDAVYLDGATIDWETRSDGAGGFKFDNPNAIDANGG